MSTAMTLPQGVSAFYDVGEILYQDRKNLANQQRNLQQLTERRILGMGTQQMATSANSSSVSRAPCNRSLSVTDAFAQQAAQFLQNQNAMGSPVLGRECSSPPTLMQNSINSMNLTNSTMNISSQNRRLDRSVSEPAGDRSGQLKNNVNTSRYKTELCRPFEESGHCKYGDKCQFAHGMDELRNLSRHPKYKTELCRTFHTIGFCPYGPRCHFVHNDDLRRLNAMNQFKINDLQQFQAVQQQQQQQQQQAYQQSFKMPSPVGSQHVVSGPTPITRPKALSFSTSMPYVRDSLGSTADSPPSSITDSPTMSPTMLNDEYLSSIGLPSAFSPPPMMSAPPTGLSGTFTFPGEDMLNSFQQSMQQPPPSMSSAMMSPLNIQTDLNQIQARLNALNLNQRNNNHHMSNTSTPVSSTCSSSSEDFTLPLFPRDSTDINAPPSPPDSLSGDSAVSSTCEYPLDVSRGLRLPIFSQLSNRE